MYGVSTPREFSLKNSTIRCHASTLISPAYQFDWSRYPCGTWSVPSSPHV